MNQKYKNILNCDKKVIINIISLLFSSHLISPLVKQKEWSFQHMSEVC